MGKLIICAVAYVILFSVFEYVNSVNMTGGSWRSIVAYGLKPWVILFFALSPILVWGITKEIYESVGNRFWYTGIILSFLEVASYFIGSWLFYRKPPSARECVGFCLMVLALLIAYDPKNSKN